MSADYAPLHRTMNHFHTKINTFDLPKKGEPKLIARLPLMRFPNELLAHMIRHVPPPHFESFVLTCTRIHSLAAPAIREYNSVRRSLRTLSPSDLLRNIVLDPGLALYPSSLSDWQTDQAFHNSLTLIDKLPSLQKLDIHTYKFFSLIEKISLILLTYYEPKPNTLSHPLLLEMLRVVHIQDTTHTNDVMDLSVLLSMIPSVRELQVSSLRNSDPYQCPYRCYNAGVTELGLQGHVDSSFAIDLICRTSHLQNFSCRHDLEPQGQPWENFTPQRIVQTLQLEAGHSLTRLKLNLSPLRAPYRRHHTNLFIGSLKRFSTLQTLETSVDFLIRSMVLREGSVDGSGEAQKLVDVMPASLQTLTLDQGLENWDGLIIEELFRDILTDKERFLPSLTVVGFVHCPDLKALMSNRTISVCLSAGVQLCCIS